jgi:hypothetical protein
MVNPTFNILAISGSLRARSSNTEALRAAAMLVPGASLELPLAGTRIDAAAIAANPEFSAKLRAAIAALLDAAAGYRQWREKLGGIAADSGLRSIYHDAARNRTTHAG